MQSSVLESDSPKLVPAFLRKQYDHGTPTLTWAVAEQVAGIRKMSLEDVIKQTSATAKEFYGI